MAYVQRYNVLIASPSDAERGQVFETVARWNGSPGNADGRVVFVPLMWEKHAISGQPGYPVGLQLLPLSQC